MIKIFTLILCLSLCTTALSMSFKRIPFHNGNEGVIRPTRVLQTINKSDESQTNTSLVTIPLFQVDNDNFVVTVDFGDAYNKANNITSPSNMMLFLFTNDTGLTFANHFYFDMNFNGLNSTDDGGLNLPMPPFELYNCFDPCSYNTNNTVSKCWLGICDTEAQVGQNIDLSIPNSTWSLNSSALFLNNVTIHALGTYGVFYHTYGFIGFGTSGDSINNFQDGHALFSVSLANQTNGDIILGNDLTKSNSSAFVASLSTDENWRIKAANVSYKGVEMNSGENKTMNMEMIFDLQYSSYAFSLPENVYKALISYFDSSNIMGCFEIEPYCYCNKSLTDLSDLKITLEDGSQFSIPSTVYMRYDPESQLFIPNFGVTARFYGIETPAIVLGSQFLSLYYAVFERTGDNSTVSLYSEAIHIIPVLPPSPYQDNDDDSSTWHYYILGALVVLIVWSLISWVCKRRKTYRQADNSSMVITERLNR